MARVRVLESKPSAPLFVNFNLRSCLSQSRNSQRTYDSLIDWPFNPGDKVALKEARLDPLVAGMNAAVLAWHLVDTVIVDTAACLRVLARGASTSASIT
jgi:hypothetical protein